MYSPRVVSEAEEDLDCQGGGKGSGGRALGLFQPGRRRWAPKKNAGGLKDGGGLDGEKGGKERGKKNVGAKLSRSLGGDAHAQGVVMDGKGVWGRRSGRVENNKT